MHLRAERRFEPSCRLHRLGVSLHRRIGLPRRVRAEIRALHEQAGTAAHFAV